MTTFFVPPANVDDDSDDETRYVDLAKFAGCAPAAPARRVYSIQFENNYIWTATVGEPTRGERTRQRRRKDPSTGRTRNVEVVETDGDSAIVRAIFERGGTFVVVTNKSIDGQRSDWENPFLAGIPRTVIYFA